MTWNTTITVCLYNLCLKIFQDIKYYIYIKWLCSYFTLDLDNRKIKPDKSSLEVGKSARLVCYSKGDTYWSFGNEHLPENVLVSGDTYNFVSIVKTYSRPTVHTTLLNSGHYNGYGLKFNLGSHLVARKYILIYGTNNDYFS